MRAGGNILSSTGVRQRTPDDFIRFKTAIKGAKSNQQPTTAAAHGSGRRYYDHFDA